MSEISVKPDMKAGNHVEFRSDQQTEKGPSAGLVEYVNGSQVAIRHSDTVEWFDKTTLRVERESKHYKTGRPLWLLV